MELKFPDPFHPTMIIAYIWKDITNKLRQKIKEKNWENELMENVEKEKKK